MSSQPETTADSFQLFHGIFTRCQFFLRHTLAERSLEAVVVVALWFNWLVYSKGELFKGVSLMDFIVRRLGTGMKCT